MNLICDETADRRLEEIERAAEFGPPVPAECLEEMQRCELNLMRRVGDLFEQDVTEVWRVSKGACLPGVSPRFGFWIYTSRPELIDSDVFAVLREVVAGCAHPTLIAIAFSWSGLGSVAFVLEGESVIYWSDQDDVGRKVKSMLLGKRE